MIGSILIGFLYAILYCAVVILIAFAFVWGFRIIFEKEIDGNVYKWGKIVVGLICFIILLTWLLGALGLGGGGLYKPFRIGAIGCDATSRHLAASHLPGVLT